MEKFLLALQFITRIPVNKELNYDHDLLAASMVYYPLIGSLLGAILAGADHLLAPYLPSLVLNSLLLVLLIVLTGGLHLDGLMDTVDGLFGGRKKEKMLEIMRDSRVGALGAIALVLCLLVKFSLLVELGGNLRTYSLLYFPTLSRWVMVYAAFSFPPARSEGLGWIYASCLNKKHLLGATIWTLGLGVFLFGLSGLGIFVVSYLIAVGIAKYISSPLKGLTGDNYGALNELMEPIVLLIMVAFLSV